MCLCLSVTTAKTAESVEMPFEILTWVDPMNEFGGQVPSGGGANLGLIAKHREYQVGAKVIL